MSVFELRDSDAAREFLLQGLCLMRVCEPSVESVRSVLEWCLELASSGEPLPPVNFVGDVGFLVLGTGDEDLSQVKPNHPMQAAVARAYDDYVLGKLYADFSFERGADAIAHFEGRDRARGLAYLLTQFRKRAGLGGVTLSPGVVKGLLAGAGENVVAQCWQSMDEEAGVSPVLSELLDELVREVRNVGDVLAPEDVFELESGTALVAFGQRLALRHMFRAAAKLSETLPQRPAQSIARKYEVPTKIFEEDTYAVGGFSSISNRGTTESLLHSQLAYMEPVGSERPDLFDIKFLRDELLYYSRDENRFLRRRRTFQFVLYPDLVETRVKTAGLPCQQILMQLAVLYSAVRQMIEWLSSDALLFEFLFVEDTDAQPLAVEREILELVFHEQTANGTVTFTSQSPRDLAAHAEQHTLRSRCNFVTVSTRARRIAPEGVLTTHLRVGDERPQIEADGERYEFPHADTLVEAWQDYLLLILRLVV